MSLLGVYGASGFGREVIAMLDRNDWNDAETVFIDDASGSSGDVSVNGYRCLSLEGFLEEADDNAKVNIAIADSTVRERIADKCAQAGLQFFSARAANCVVLDEVEIGSGATLCPFVTLTSNIIIGRQFHANIYSYVAHDCVIGDFVTFAPSVMCNGNVHIHDHAYIGSGAIIRQGAPGKPLVIGRGAVVGMGAVVTKNVPAGATVVGNPARLLERR